MLGRCQLVDYFAVGSGEAVWSCCSDSQTCGASEGDCDRDTHCTGDLICGNNNCNDLYSSVNIYQGVDCCVPPS